MILGERSLMRLRGVHPALQEVVRSAAGLINEEESPMDFIVTEGVRTKERQAQLVKAGASRTMNSRHITGHAVDLAVLVDGEVRWDWPLYGKLAAYVKQAAHMENVAIIWGGDFRTFKDGPHFELNRKDYP
jgi:peptidoglycan LD-endopeptidase CwlK